MRVMSCAADNGNAEDMIIVENVHSSSYKCIIVRCSGVPRLCSAGTPVAQPAGGPRRTACRINAD